MNLGLDLNSGLWVYAFKNAFSPSKLEEILYRINPDSIWPLIGLIETNDRTKNPFLITLFLDFQFKTIPPQLVIVDSLTGIVSADQTPPTPPKHIAVIPQPQIVYIDFGRLNSKNAA